MSRSVHGLLRLLALLRLPQALLASGPPAVRILMYHGVTGRDVAAAPFGGRGKHVARSQFEQQVAWLARHGRILSLTDLVRPLRSGQEPPPRGFVITLDDGYRNNLVHAQPVLSALDAPATVYVTTDLIDGRCLWVDRVDAALEAAPAGRVRSRLPDGDLDVAWDGPEGRLQAGRRLRQAGKSLAGADRDRLVQDVVDAGGFDLEAVPRDQRPEDVRGLTPEELRRLPVTGMSVGAHTVSHQVLSRCSGSLLQHELVSGRERLEAWLGAGVIDFAYPNGGAGDFDARTGAAVEAAGYRTAMTTLRGRVTAGADLWTLPRVPINADEPFEGFLADVSGLRDRLLAARRRLRLRPQPRRTGP